MCGGHYRVWTIFIKSDFTLSYIALDGLDGRVQHLVGRPSHTCFVFASTWLIFSILYFVFASTWLIFSILFFVSCACGLYAVEHLVGQTAHTCFVFEGRIQGSTHLAQFCILYFWIRIKSKHRWLICYILYFVAGIHAKNVWCCGEAILAKKNLRKKCVNRDKM